VIDNIQDLLSTIDTLVTGGPDDLYVKVSNEGDLEKLVRAMGWETLQKFEKTTGKGTNLVGKFFQIVRNRVFELDVALPPKPNTPAPVLVKPEETITRTGLTWKKLGSHAEFLLNHYDYLKKLPTVRRKPASFAVLKPLPTKDEMQAIRTEHFTVSVGDLVSDSFNELQSLGSELREWYDNMPEGLRGSSKGDEVEAAADPLEQLTEPEVPGEVSGIKIVFIPSELLDTKAQRRDNAVNGLQAVIEGLDGAKDENGDDLDVSGFISDLEAVISEADGVEFPSFN
jgi:hypothetical protein